MADPRASHLSLDELGRERALLARRGQSEARRQAAGAADGPGFERLNAQFGDFPASVALAKRALLCRVGKSDKRPGAAKMADFFIGHDLTSLGDAG
jgi:hypothetical protein